MYDENAILTQSIIQAIKHGKTQTAIQTYIKAISRGLSIKINFRGTLEQNPLDDKAEIKKKKKDHPIVDKTKYAMQGLQRKMSGGAAGPAQQKQRVNQKLQINKIQFNLPSVEVETRMKPLDQLIFFTPDRNGASIQQIAGQLKAYFKNMSLQ